MYCINCGEKLYRDCKFCPNCGVNFSEKITKNNNEVVMIKRKTKKKEKACWGVFAKVGCFLSFASFLTLILAEDAYYPAPYFGIGYFLFNISLVFSILGTYASKFKNTAAWGIFLSIIGIGATLGLLISNS